MQELSLVFRNGFSLVKRMSVERIELMIARVFPRVVACKTCISMI